MILTAAIDSGNLDRVRQLAAETSVRLDDAARILALIAQHEPQHFERAAVRWLARYADERAKTLEDIDAALDALSADPIRVDMGVLARLAKP